MPGAALERRRARPLCKKIKSRRAEQYHANTKYTEAVAVAAEACAEDTKGQTCFICTQALHWKTKQASCGCACRDGGLAHVSCWRSRQDFARGGLENNLGDKAKEARFHGV